MKKIVLVCISILALNPIARAADVKETCETIGGIYHRTSDTQTQSCWVLTKMSDGPNVTYRHSIPESALNLIKEACPAGAFSLTGQSNTGGYFSGHFIYVTASIYTVLNCGDGLNPLE